MALEILSPILLPEKNIMLLQYVEAAVKKAQYKQLEDDSWFAEISGYPGVWANPDFSYALDKKPFSMV